MNARRQIVLGLAAAVAGATAPRAQTSGAQVRRVGSLTLGTQAAQRAGGAPFREEMARLGWVEGRTVIYDPSAADGQPALLPQRAAELVARRPDVIVCLGLQVARAAKQATTTIPIVFFLVITPVEQGLVASLARPGGKLTGVSPNLVRLLPKRIQLLREMLPNVKRIGVLRPPDDPVLDRTIAEIQPALAPLGVTIIGAGISDAAGIEPAVAQLVGARVEAIIDAMVDLTTAANLQRLIELTNRARLPYVGTWGFFADAGALFGYGGSAVAGTRALARMVDKILRGANPADLPVEAVDEFDFVVNLKAARLFGIKVPQSVLLRTTRVIE